MCLLLGVPKEVRNWKGDVMFEGRKVLRWGIVDQRRYEKAKYSLNGSVGQRREWGKGN